MLQDLMTQPKTVGIKETMKAVQEGKVQVVFVAKDAAKHMRHSIVSAAEAHNVQIMYVDAMTELGKACNVEVKTATAALLINNEGGAH